MSQHVIKGRPDFEIPGFGETEAKNYPPYVYSRSGNSALIHKVARVTIRWWRGDYDRMVRDDKPTVIAETVCGVSRFIHNGRAAVCELPADESVMCARCQGAGTSNFGKHGITKISRKQAAKLLACALSEKMP